MQQTITGRAYVLGDNIDTDQIIPAHYLNLVPTITEEYVKLGSYAMAGLPESCAPFIDKATGRTPYTIMIAGTNFGCGSSREHAPVALGAAGCKAVVAFSPLSCSLDRCPWRRTKPCPRAVGWSVHRLASALP